MIIGTDGFSGSLKLDFLTKIGAELHASPASEAGREVWTSMKKAKSRLPQELDSEKHDRKRRIENNV